MHPALTLLAPKLFSLGRAAYQQVQLIHELKALPHRQALERFDNHVGSLTAAGRIGFAVTLALQVNQEKDPQTRSLLESMQARLADPQSTGSATPAAGIASIEPLHGFAPSAERPDAKAGLARWVATESDTERRSSMASRLSGLSAQGLGDFATELNAAKVGCEERIQYHRDNEARIVAGRFFEDQMPYKMLVAQTGRHDPQWQRTLDALEQERDRFGEAMSMAGDTLIALLEQSHRPHEAHCGQKVDSADSAHPDDSATEKAGEKRGFKRLTVFVSHCWKDKVHPHFGELCAQLEPFTL